MYQCQMGKQTMATPTHTWHLNSETKMYRLQTPTSPFFRPAHYDYIDMDDYPMGTNAVVAVISYTGYDMEDAMIINKSSYDRGFAAGTIYKCVFVDLKEMSAGKRFGRDADSCDLSFERDPANAALAAFLDVDGLPFPGTQLKDGDPYYCYYSSTEGKYMVKRFEGKEVCFVDSVKACGNDAGTCQLNRVCISFRIPRNPSVGDKFASRAGQKGTCFLAYCAPVLNAT
jgi:DNA-directed RNA polymerase I subunit RPA2